MSMAAQDGTPPATMHSTASSASFGRPMTASSSAPGTPGGGGKGVKRVLNELCGQVEAQGEELRRVREEMKASDSSFQDIVDALERRMVERIEQVRKELRAHQEATKAQVAQIQEQIGAMTGEAGILKEQTRDSHKRIKEISQQLHILNVELLGE